jgi:hypothetical protein
MTQPEAKLSRAIMKELRLDGHFCFKVHGSEFMMAGLPDIIVCADGLFIGLETKMPGKRSNTSPRQDYVHALIRASGGNVYVVCSVAEARSVIASVLDDTGDA